MIEKTLEQLEEDLAAARLRQKELREGITSLNLRLVGLPESHDEVVRRRRRIFRWSVALLAAAPLLLVAYHETLRPQSDFDERAERRARTRIDYERAELSELAPLEELRAWATADAERRRDARLPRALGRAQGREAYVAFRDRFDADRLDPATHDVVLRWGNVAIAACKVREQSLARRALGAVRWLGTPRSNGLPLPDWQRFAVEETETQRAATSVVAWAMTQCMMSGTDVLPMFEPDP